MKFTAKYIWGVSKLIHSPFTIKNYLFRFKFCLLAFLHKKNIVTFLNTENNELFKKEIITQPDILGILIWPYIHKDWSFEEKSKGIKEHYFAAISFPILCISSNESKEILDLSHIREGFKVVLDKAKWFRREGELVLNLFLAEDRIYSLAFSIGRKNDKNIIYVGGIQGVTIDNIMVTYKEITKALFGMRPRDFLLNILKIISSEIGIDEILAISNKNRHHNHSYFKAEKTNDALTNYDTTWIEHKGEESSDGFFHIKSKLELRPIEEISAKKRSMYRKRYALLDDLVAKMAINVENFQ